MERCFALAERGKNRVRLNPKVGAVLVHDGRIIGEGYHRSYGQSHAEVNAIESVKVRDRHLIKQSTLYSSLEPCNHHGKTPPCTQIIAQHGIPRIVVSTLDPNPRMRGKSLDILSAKGVQVTKGILEEKGRALIRPYRIMHNCRRPYVILKFAQSANGMIGRADRQVWLTNEQSDILSHRWRAEIDGIMVGTNTAVLDNPRLTTRLHPGPDPMRILLDRRQRVPKSHHLLSDPHPTLIFTEHLPDSAPHSKRFVAVPFDDTLIQSMLAKLLELEIVILMIEGGAHLIRSFVDLGLWDEARIFRCPQSIEGGISAPSIEGRLVRKQQIENDELLYIYNPHEIKC